MGSSGTTGKKGPSSTLCGLLLALLKQFSLPGSETTFQTTRDNRDWSLPVYLVNESPRVGTENF